MKGEKIMSKLSKDDLSLIKGIVGEVVEEKVTPLRDSISSLEKKVNALSKDNAPSKQNKATEKKSEKAPEKAPEKDEAQPKEVVKRWYFQATERLAGQTFRKVYDIVKQYDGKIKKSEATNKKGERLALWTFTEENGDLFAKALMECGIWKKVENIPFQKKLVSIEKK